MCCYEEQLLACTCITLWCILLSKLPFFFFTIIENVFNYDKEKSNKCGRQNITHGLYHIRQLR